MNVYGLYEKLKSLFVGFVSLCLTAVIGMSSISFFMEGDILYGIALLALTPFSIGVSVMFFSDLRRIKDESI
ncbi:MAG: hypothetical protein AB2411_17705 [Mesobacillus sp.]